MIAGLATIAHEWQRRADSTIREVQANGPRTAVLAGDKRRGDLFNRFRAAIAVYQPSLDKERAGRQAHAELIAIGLIVILSLVFSGLGYVVIELRFTADEHHRETQREFLETMQMTRTETEAYALLKRHLERTAPRSVAVVLNRNNSDNRLEAATPLEEHSPLRERLIDAEPDSCLTIRLGRTHERVAGDESLLGCELCGGCSRSTCVPSLVGGEVIGSVLIEHARALGKDARRLIFESVSQAAPVLANLRNLALAEMRAATDALTGLPNTRALQDTFKRMLAHSGRTVEPMSVVLFDLDHFKKINDTYGHEHGDEVLAAVGDALAGSLRASDFAGRNGGEEFLVLLPDTDKDGALTLAEKLRETLTKINVPGVAKPISGSFGIATFPGDGTDTATLLRLADRALYEAKSAGRNCVHAATDAIEPAAIQTL
jgi:diguanylate cyclase (GGDEF)-like protein